MHDRRQRPLVPRTLFFGNPERQHPRISPDGRRLSYLAPLDGVMNLWLAPLGGIDRAVAVTHEMSRPIRFHAWAFTSRHLLYLQDSEGDENHHLYCVEIYSDDTVAEDAVDLTPLDEVQARITHMSPRRPEELLVGLNDRDRGLHDVYLVDLKTRERRRVQQNPGFVEIVADEDLTIRLGVETTPGGGKLLKRKGEDGSWESFLSIPLEDEQTTGVVGFDASGQTLYMRWSLGRDTSALVGVDMGSGEPAVLSEDEVCDVDDVLVHPTSRMVQGVCYTYARKQWQAVDEAIDPALQRLQGMADGELSVLSRDLTDERWVVSLEVDAGPTGFYLYDRVTDEAELLFNDRPELENVPLARMHTAIIPARDGKQLVSHYGFPVVRGSGSLPDSPSPLVVLVHGGPWARDYWGYEPVHQWLVDRGYTVLRVNYRGSTGFGKAFVNAGNLEWAGAMHRDLLDAVQWAVDTGVADPERVAIMGASYGGYAALVGLTFTPETFRCGVDLVGPSDLPALLESIPPYWAPEFETLAGRVGDPRTAEGRRLLEERSPLLLADRIERPLLIAQGANDPRVKQAQSDRIVEAMRRRDVAVTYLLYPDEGHGLARPENRLSFYAVVEAFLAACLGGRFEEVGRDFEGSSIRVVEGAGGVPGLEEALRAHLTEDGESC